MATAQSLGLPRTVISTNYANLAPRFGFAWRPFGGLKTVVRGGYGIFYNSSIQNPIRTQMGDQFPYAIAETYSKNASKPTFLTLETPFPTGTKNVLAGQNNVSGYTSVQPPTGYLQSWNLTVEREIRWGAAVEVAYIASKGTHLGQKYNANQLPFNIGVGTLPKPYAGFGTVSVFDFGANSTYQSGMVTLRKRFSRGLFYRLNYVYGKSIDDASQLGGSSDGGYGGALDAYDLRLERGRSDWDVRQTFSMILMYDLPFQRHWYSRRWQIGATGRMYTGAPFTPQISTVDLNLGESGRPNRIANGALSDPQPLMWFNLAAFPVVPPGAYTYGNSGRNILDGPGDIEMNLSLIKTFHIRERSLVQFRAEAFNFLNHANFNLPNPNVDAPNGGVVTAAGAPRQVQFGLRLTF